MADQVDFPDIYIDSSVGDGGVGSEADPYNDFADINWTTGGDNSVYDYYAGSPSASVTINLQKGEIWREKLTIKGSGNATYRIIVQAYGAGDNPEINGSDLVSGWTLSGTGSVYKAGVATEPEQVWIDETFGDRRDVSDALGGGAEPLVNEYDWFWDEAGDYLDEEADTLYLYAPADPDTQYTTPGVEASSKTMLINTNVNDYLTIDGITCSKSNQHCIFVNSGDHITVSNCIGEWGWEFGIKYSGSSAVETDIIVEDSIGRYCGNHGISYTVLAGTTASYFTIRRCKAYENARYTYKDIDWSNNHVFTGGIKVWTNFIGISHLELYENECYSNGAESEIDNSSQKGNGIWIDNVDGSDGDPVIVKHNRCYDNSGSGIFVEISSWNSIYGNVLYGNATSTDTPGDYAGGGIRIDARDGFKGEYHNIYNNTIYDTIIGLHATTYQRSAGTSLSYNTLKNNIVSNCELVLRAKWGGDNDTWGTDNVYNNNCFGAQTADFISWGASTYSTYDAWLAASSQTDNNIESDPSFADAGSDDFTLSADSPCISTGVNLGAPYNQALIPGSAWPSDVVTGDQDDY